MFGSGPVFTSGRVAGTGWDLASRVLILTMLAAIGTSCVVYLIGRAARVLLPRPMRLSELPKGFRARVEAQPDVYLVGARTVEEFAAKLRIETMSRLDNDRWILLLQSQLAQAPTDAPRCERTAEELRIRRSYMRMLDWNVDFLSRKRAELLDQYGYQQTIDAFTSAPTRLVLAAGTAVVTGVLYITLWGVFTDAADPQTASPDVGVLHRSGPASDSLWETLSLAECEVGDADETSGRVPVLVSGGSGSRNDPYIVRPLSATDECTDSTFSVIDEVAIVEIPRAPEIQITYVPSSGEGTADDSMRDDASDDE